MSAEAESSSFRLLLAEAVVLVVIAAVCVFLRVHQIELQSLTPDEYTTYYFDPSAKLEDYLRLNSYRLPDNLPLYPALLHGWLSAVGFSVIHARMFSVVLGVASLLLVWRIGREIACRTTGLAAALLYALSPLCIFHDQAVRQYPLLMTLALASVWCMLRLIRQGPSLWWVAAVGMVNVAMVYTHLLAAVFLAAEGVFLCWLWRKRLRWLMVWAVPQICLVLPALSFVQIPDTDPHYPPMHFSRYLLNLFHADTVDWSPELIVSRDNWGFTYVGYDNFWFATMASSVVVGMLAVGGAARILLRRKDGARFAQGILLICVFALPGLLLYILSQFVDPMSLPRYTIYSNAIRYLLAAYAIAWIPWRAAQVPVLAVVLTLLAVQLSALLPYGARNEDVRVARHIQERSRPGDSIIITLHPDVLYVHLPLNGDMDRISASIMRYHLASPLPTTVEHTLHGAAASAASQLADNGAQSRSVWLVVMRMFQPTELVEFQMRLREHQLAYESKTYYGFSGITLYRISKREGAAVVVDLPPPELDVQALLSSWGVTLPDGVSAASVAPDFHARLDGPPAELSRAGDYSALALVLGSRNPALGRALSAAGIQRFPQSGALYLADGFLGYLAGDATGGAASLAKAQPLLDRGLRAGYGPIVEAMLAGNHALGLERFRRLQQISGGIFDPLVEDALRVASGS